MAPTAHVEPSLPSARGPLSSWLLAALHDRAPASMPPLDDADPLIDDDFHLALYCSYELTYRGFAGIDTRRETDPRIEAVRRRLEDRFEAALRAEVAPRGAGTPDAADEITRLLTDFTGPSLSRHMADDGTVEQFREFLVHRSAYQLKEADPHSWALPRLRPGARKSAFVEIQADEYGGGRPHRSHAELFAAAMDAAGLDPAYGHHLERLPGVTLATCNLISMFGLQRRLLGAVIGHLAVFEMTSVTPMSRYAHASDRLGLSHDVRAFYDVHVEADDHHGRLAHDALLGGDLLADGIDPADVVFGAQALLTTEDRFARHLLHSWTAGRSSLRPEHPTTPHPPATTPRFTHAA